MEVDIPNPISLQIVRGCHQFKISNSETKNIGIGNFVSTPEFFVGGVSWLIEYYPQGKKANNKGTYISFSLQLMSPSRVVTADYELGLIDKYGTPSAESWIRSTDTFPSRTGWYFHEFLKRSDLESNFIKDDHFIVVCSVTLRKEPLAVLNCCSLGPFRFNLAQELHILLERKEETDVTFQVEGQDIAAHRLIVASRSPVFKSELYGQMVEGTSKIIEIKDMQALVFRAMLHFMYSDSIPAVEKLVTEGNLDLNKPEVTLDLSESSTKLYQHLIVAADRYAVEGLKTQCEEWLCRRISMDTVVPSLSVAERHHCEALKEQCLAFIADPQNTLRVLLKKDYTSLVYTYPSIQDELERKLGIL